jgi:hypothetical protein
MRRSDAGAPIGYSWPRRLSVLREFGVHDPVRHGIAIAHLRQRNVTAARGRSSIVVVPG